MPKHTHAKKGGGVVTHGQADSDNPHGTPGKRHTHDGMLPVMLPGSGGLQAAELKGGARGNLPDSAFAHIDSDGGRHLPIHDAPHVRSALSRFGQTKFETAAQKRKAAGKIKAAASKHGVEVSGDALKMSEQPAVVRMLLPGQIDLAEKRLPLAVTGQWVWDDYGQFEITADDLDAIQANFTENARRQDLPLLNEDHDKSRAIGWITGMERVSPDRLDAIVDVNPTGETLLANDEYRYVSPELLRNYTDAETGQNFSMVAVGHAVTNKPRIKSLGRIALSESGVQAGVLAMSEGPATGYESPADAVEHLLLAEVPMGDDGDPLPPCSYAPPFSEMGRCPGYTKILSDGDGDKPGDLPGCCALAAQCNGYSPVNQATTSPFMYSEGDHRMANTANGTEGVAAAGVPTTPAVPAAVASEAAPAVDPVALSERDREISSLRAELETERKARVDLSEKFAAQQQATKIAQTQARIDDLVRANKMTPAEAKAFSEDQHLLLFSENPSLFKAFDEREAAAVPFSETGSGSTPPTGDNRARLAAAVREFSEKQKQEGKRPNAAEAAAYALRTVGGA